MSTTPQVDWFAQNAPQAHAQAGGDWFTANAPSTSTSTPQPNYLKREAARIIQNPLRLLDPVGLVGGSEFAQKTAQAVGLPTTPEEYKALAESEAAKPIAQRALEAIPLVSSAPAVVRAARQASRESTASTEALRRGDIPGFVGHGIGEAGYTGAALAAPVLGETPTRAGEAFGRGDVEEGLASTTAAVAPFAVGTLLPKGGASGALSKAATTPEHVEALTGFIKTTKTDPHITASVALPEARAVAAHEGIDPSTFQGRKGGEIVTGKNGILHKAIQEHRAEYAALRHPVEKVQLDTTPIAQAYLDKITPEMRTDAPHIAERLTAEAEKFADVSNGRVIGVQPRSLANLDDFRVRLNNELDTYEQKPIDQQIRSDVEVKADKAAVDAARDLIYKSIARNSPDPVATEAHIRDLQQRQGALIEARRDLTQAFNQASGAQGEAVSGSLRANPEKLLTLREKAGHLYPSRHGVERSLIREVVSPKPLDLFNNRLRMMFGGLKEATTKPTGAPALSLGPGAPGLAGTTRSISLNGQPLGHITYEVSGDTLTIYDLGGPAQDYNSMSNKLGQRGIAQITDVLKQENPGVKYVQGIRVGGARGEAGRSVRVPVSRLPKSEPTVQPPYRADSTLSAQQKATAWLLAAKRGDVSQAEADKRIQKLVGSGGRKIRLAQPVGGSE